MTNLEKLTAGEVAARNNGTLDQLREVIEHCFQRHKTTIYGTSKYYYTIIYGTSKYYYLASWDKLDWDCNDTTDLPTIDIAQLWQELQALKKPEIWWIRVTSENVGTLSKWYGSKCLKAGEHITGMVMFRGNLEKGFSSMGKTKTCNYDYGNEIDFATFLKYTGVEPEKVEKSLEEKISEVKKLINSRDELVKKFNKLQYEIFELDTKLSALLK